MTSPAIDRRSTDLALARLHLRVGSLALARIELETLAGRGSLDDEALVDLSEARWRTGDLGRAGEAATAALDHGVEAPLALMIAAEAAFDRGRPGEARRLATRAMTAAGGTLDALFAGMPRSSVWPPDPADPAPLATTLFGDEPSDTGPVPIEEGAEAGRTIPDGTVAAAAIPGAVAPGLWDEDSGAPAGQAPIDPAMLMEQGMAAVDAGDPDRAAALLGLAIRIGPHLAPSILDRTSDVTRPGLLLVRGDAFRLTGHEADAAVAYAAAAEGLGEAVPTAPHAPSVLASGAAPQADPQGDQQTAPLS